MARSRSSRWDVLKQPGQRRCREFHPHGIDRAVRGLPRPLDQDAARGSPRPRASTSLAMPTDQEASRRGREDWRRRRSRSLALNGIAGLGRHGKAGPQGEVRAVHPVVLAGQLHRPLREGVGPPPGKAGGERPPRRAIRAGQLRQVRQLRRACARAVGRPALRARPALA